MAYEVKVEVLSFKKKPGMCPYFVLVGNPKTINERNEFGQVDLGICEEASG